MAREEFKLPDVGEGVAEGELVNWLVDVGDTVTEDQPVAEVETDKALVDVPSPYNGTVAEILADEGEMVPVGNVIIVFETDEDADVSDAGAAADESASEADAGAAADTDGAADEGATAEGAPENGADGEVTASEGRVFAPPSARKKARELGVDITNVEGSGPSGRITTADVEAYADTGGDTPEPKSVDIDDGESVVSGGDGETAAGGSGAGSTAGGAAAGAAGGAGAVESADRERTLAVPATRRVADEEGVDLDAVPTEQTRDGEAFVTADQVRQYAEAQQAAQAADAGAVSGSAANGAASAGATAGDAEPGVAERRPYRGVRRTIGEKMAESKYTAPHVTHHDTAVVDDLVDTRTRLKPRAEAKEVSLTYMPFVVKAIIAALKEFPILNAQLNEEDEEIVIKDEYHIGIAVATDAGLMVPVVENADQKGLLELSQEINDLASRARSRDLSPDELQGSTFTISNFGVFGGEYATPIINYPETAILGLGELDERPVAEDGQVRAAQTMPLSVSIDHRIVDGAEVAQFTNLVMEHLESPELLLL
jgi:pyruvate dehydrogenase E2 component (dihydrolipoamide acetyltransferase)